MIYRCFAVLLALCMVCGAVATAVTEKQDFSELENRALTARLTFTWQDIRDGRFIERTEQYLAEQWAGRRVLLSIRSLTELSFGRRENNGVVWTGRYGLIASGTHLRADAAEQNANAMQAFVLKKEKNGESVSIMIAPMKADIAGVMCGGEALREDVWKIVNNKLKGADRLTKVLENATADGEEIFYRTDHHWNVRGAHIAYAEICNQLALTPYPVTAFEVQTIRDDFRGSLYSKSGMLWLGGETLTLWRYEGDGGYSVTLSDGEELMIGHYDMSFSAKKDGYSIWYGGNHGYMKIVEKYQTQREELVVIKDSFANSVLPFLALHYDLTVIDPRYIDPQDEQVLAALNQTNVLILCGMETIATDTSIARLLTNSGEK